MDAFLHFTEHRKVIFSCFGYLRHDGSLSWCDTLRNILLDTSLGCQETQHIATLILLDDLWQS